MALDKRKLHHYLRSAQSLKTWQLVIILFLMLLISATLLRLNNIGMVERRQAVIDADRSGNQEELEQALQELRRYVNSHMNTSLGDGVYLEHKYARDRDAALEAAANTMSSTNPNSAAYQQASIECRSRFAGGRESYRNDYVQCVIDRVGAMTQAGDPTAGINLPRADLYRYDFASPVLSLDMAGLSVFLSLLLLTFIALRVIFVGIIKMLLKRRYSRIYS